MPSQTRVLFCDEKYIVELDANPYTPGTVYVSLKDGQPGVITVMDLTSDTFLDIMLLARAVANKICSALNVQRCAMVGSVSCKNEPGVRIIPLHGLSNQWNAMLSGKPEFNESYQGCISSHNGPEWSENKLTDLQEQIRNKLSDSDDKEISHDFDGDAKDTNLFAKLIRGEIPQWRIWEDKTHVSFLTPFPNTPGFTVVIPRKHLSSDIFSLEKDDYISLLKACHRVSHLLHDGIPGTKTCGIIFEGFEIDYAHAKIIPIIGDLTVRCNEIDFCEKYQGYVSSKHGKLLTDEEIVKMSKILKMDDLEY